MARKPLTEEQIAERNAIKEALKANYVRPYSRKSQTQTNSENTSTNTAIMDNTEGAAKPANETQTQSKFNPTGGKRISRTYSNPEVDARLISTDIPEHDIGSSNTSNIEELITNRAKGSESEPKGTTPPKQQTNQTAQNISEQLGTQDFTPVESRQNAEELVGMALGAYGELWSLGANLVSVKEEKLIKLNSEGKLNMHAIFIPKEQDPRRNGITNYEFLLSMNKQISTSVAVSDKFKEEITPPLTRLALKYKLGISDEGKVAILLGKDMFKKSMVLYQMSKMVNGALQAMQANSAANINQVIEERTAEIQNKAAQAMSSLDEQRVQQQKEYEKKIAELEAKLNGAGTSNQNLGEIKNPEQPGNLQEGAGVGLMLPNENKTEGA